MLIWIILFGLMDMIIMPMVTAHGEELKVPNLLEMPYDQARKRARDLGFRIHSKIEERYDPFYPENIIIEQHPAPYTLSKKGRKIRIVLSAGEKLYPVPEVVGISEKEAIMKLKSEGFQVIEDSLKFIFSDYYPEGVVAEQSMPVGTMLKKGEPINLTISLGSKPSRFIVPEVETMTLQEAKRALYKAGLTVGLLEWEEFTLADSGIIIEQIPQPGTTVEESSAVNLIISDDLDSTEIDTLFLNSIKIDSLIVDSLKEVSVDG